MTTQDHLPPEAEPAITAGDLHFALRVLVRNERKNLLANHPAVLERPDLWYPSFLDDLAKRLNDRTWRPQPALTSARLKGPFATRPLILPRGPEELIVYAHLAARLHAALSDERRGWYGRTLFGNVPTAPGSVSLLEPYLPHMLALNEHLEKEVKRYPVILSLDISGFYEHVQHRVLLDTVQRERLLGPLDQWLLAQMLGSFAARFGGQGNLPQGLPQSYPALSALLAEVYMLPVDRRLQQLGLRYTRYVDDFRIFTPSRARAEVQAFQVEATLRAVGLSFSGEKTRVYDRRVDPIEGFPLMGGSPASRLSDNVTRWAGAFPHHQHYLEWQQNLRALWETQGALRAGRPFHRTVVRFCLSRLEPDPDLIPDVVEVLRQHPQEFEAVTWFLSRVPREHLPWDDLRSALPEHHQASAAASLLRVLAPRRTTYPWPERPVAVESWLRSLRRHPLDTVRITAKEASRAWQHPQRRPDHPASPCDAGEVARALAAHLELSSVPQVQVKLPQVPSPSQRKRWKTLELGGFTLAASQEALEGMLEMAQYHHVSGFFKGVLPVDGQNLHSGHVLNMIGRLGVLRERDRAVYAWALTRLMDWLEPGLPTETREKVEGLLREFLAQRRAQVFTTRQEYQDAVYALNKTIFREVREVRRKGRPIEAEAGHSSPRPNWGAPNKKLAELPYLGME